MSDRRDFLRMSAGFAAWTAFCPSLVWGAELSLADYAAQLKTATSALGAKIVTAPRVAELHEHLEASTAVWAPKPQTFSEQYDLPIRLATEGNGDESIRSAAAFSYPTVMSGRSLAVTNLPHLIHTNDNPTPETRLNVSEMAELGNTKNPLLWTPCGCHIVQLPVSTKERIPPTQKDFDSFGEWVEAGGANTAGASPGSRLSLQYVRQLCRCDGLHLTGFGFEHTPQANQAVATSRDRFTQHAAFGVTNFV